MSKSVLPSAVAGDDECDDKLLTYKEVAPILKIGAQTVAIWGTQGVIPSYLIGKHSRRYKLSEIQKYIASCKVAAKGASR